MKSTLILGALEAGMTAGTVSRRDALMRTGRLAGAAAVATLPLSLGLLARKVHAQTPTPMTEEEIDILNFALTLERLEAAFYSEGLASGVDFGDTQAVFDQISKHEAAHVLLLETLLGVNAAPAPTFDFTAGGFGNPFSSLGSFVAASQAFEDLGVRAYKGQVGGLAGSAELLTTALRIHSTEARHAAMVRRLSASSADKAWITGSDGTPAEIYAGEENTTQLGVDLLQFGSADAVSEAFDEPIAREEVEALIEPMIIPAEEPPPEG